MCDSPVFVATCPIVLASGSPRRRDFLASLGLTFSVLTAPHAEPAPMAGDVPLAFAQRAAHDKTHAVVAEHAKVTGDAAVIGADTIVVLGTEIMGKPEDDMHAYDMLSRLSGTTHEVITGVCVILPQGETHTFAVATRVTMAAHGREALEAYIRTGEPEDKAGAYAIQGIGSFLIERIEGSWSNVVGLPVTELLDVLRRKGVIVPAVA